VAGAAVVPAAEQDDRIDATTKMIPINLYEPFFITIRDLVFQIEKIILIKLS
jgi:hypothetical protein